jgi:hypothetical protein
MKKKCRFFPDKGTLFFISFAVLFLRSVPSPAQTETHPCILYLAQERDTIRNRLVREPYAGWKNQLISQADIALNSWNGTGVPKITQAYYSKMLAAAYVFSDSIHPNHYKYGSESAKALAAVPNGSYTSPYFTSDLEISEAAVYWAEAYDMLRGENFDFTLGGTTQEVISGRFSKLRAYMAKNNVTDYLLSTGIAHDYTSSIWVDAAHTDNHHVKLQAAIVVLSLSILGESGSPGDLSNAQTRLMNSIGNLALTTGGWAEGPDYHLYSAQQYLPALVALKNMNLLDFTTIAELTQTHLWVPRILMPDGLTPPFNDDLARYFDLSGLLYSLYKNQPDRDALFWAWNQIGKAVSPMFLPDFIARYDDTHLAHSDPGALGWTPTDFYPESGFARFRDSWSANGIYMQFLAKHGDARIKGQAHSHSDPNSFMLHAFGNMLLLDSGYGGFAVHDSPRFARNHNLILVDGDGPPGASKDPLTGFWVANSSDAFLDKYFTDSSLDYAHSTTQYRDAIFERSVLFPSHRYFFLFDHIYSPEKRTYTLLLHGNGGGTSGGTFTNLDSGALWQQNWASVRTFTVGSSPLTFATTDMKHAVYSSSLLSHTVLEASQNASEALFLTLIYPDRKGAAAPTISPANVSLGKGISMAFNDTTEYGAMRTGILPMTLTAGSANLTTDGKCFLARFVPHFTLNNFSLFDGSFVASGPDTLIKSLKPVNLTVVYENQNTVSGYIQTDTGTTITLSDFRATSVTFRGSGISFVQGSHSVQFAVPSDGQWRVRGYSCSQTLQPPRNVSVADVPNDNGHHVRLTWSKSPSENDKLVDWYRIYRSRNPVLTDPIVFPKNVTVDSLLTLESKFTVLVDSVKAGITEYIDGVYYNGAPCYYWLQAVGSGTSSQKVAARILTGVEDTPGVFWFGNPYPNPFNPLTQIEYFIPEEALVTIAVYTVTGQRAAILRDEVLKAGRYSNTWRTIGMPSGIYFVKISAGRYTTIKKMALVK